MFSDTDELSADVAELSALSTVSVRLDFFPLFFGSSACLFSSVADSAFSDAFSTSAAFFSSAFLSASATVEFNFSIAFFNSSTCFSTSVAVTLSFSNNSLASAKTLSRSLAILLIFSASVALISLSKLIVNLFNSALSAFAVGNADAGTSTEIFFVSVSESSADFSPSFDVDSVVFSTLTSCVAGTSSALADIPPPKNISDATATLAAPK